jgi:hypothetical protein
MKYEKPRLLSLWSDGTASGDQPDCWNGSSASVGECSSGGSAPGSVCYDGGTAGSNCSAGGSA